ncbi:MAG: hypothetical protein ACTSXD_10155 [Candidatus Heimdallarchaeaceae archaeon]
MISMDSFMTIDFFTDLISPDFQFSILVLLLSLVFIGRILEKEHILKINTFKQKLERAFYGFQENKELLRSINNKIENPTISDVVTKWKDEEIKSSLKIAEELVISAIYPFELLTSIKGDLIPYLVENKIKMRILLTGFDFESHAFKNAIMREDFSSEEQREELDRSRISNTKYLLKQIISKVEEGIRKKSEGEEIEEGDILEKIKELIKIKVNNYYSGYILSILKDRTMKSIAFVTINNFRQEIDDRLYFKIFEKDNERWFKHFERDFENMWSISGKSITEELYKENSKSGKSSN